MQLIMSSFCSSQLLLKVSNSVLPELVGILQNIFISDFAVSCMAFLCKKAVIKVRNSALKLIKFAL